MEMNTSKDKKSNIYNLLVYCIVLITFTHHVTLSHAAAAPPGVKLVADAVVARFNNLSALYKEDIKKELKFCVENVDADWDSSFNFSRNSDFTTSPYGNKGDVAQRVCSGAEIKFYVTNLADSAKNSGGPAQQHYLKPNNNCNLSSWPAGCEPGWACSIGKNESVDPKTKTIPSRIKDCQPCCEGFFCPEGLSCMIPCPLGTYCPLAKLNETSGLCDPYGYQLPPGDSNHTCGGAHVWADYVSAPSMFCPAGFYCPTNTQKIRCNRGYYCRAGSTSQTKCYKLATCDPQSANQNITVYGVLFFGGLMLVLLIIYNCSDQVISDREKRQAKSREAAARSAKETVQVRERWKSAKETAKGLQSSLSRTFSKTASMKGSASKSMRHPKPGSDAALPPKKKDKGKKKETNLTKMMQELEENPDSHEGFDVEIGDKNIKKQALNKKQLQTRSQIFRYAYGQIEKEKAFQEQTQNMTFSGVISMANDMDISARLPIEVIFKNLTLTLKGKNKHLLRSVSGTLSPGRVSAVMGPSGAGKTTFLSALTGRFHGCTISGQILINGKHDSMQSYKRVLGFVPQDDIVHGNLTVEENLWFSARCRLPADLSKAEKVLVIERVIESLGLQLIRDSLVGTVEKRGISGGQRKRVNVGLEMVMDPSLLILDEPTSGLDSASSLLLLRALRREALEGVNIVMVLHQPSYTLFQMFDDIILLAKGGLTAYHGPVKKVEEYFSGLGIDVPERVNPPDHYIDILEGIVKPSAGSGVTAKDLPLRWMLHNGYPVPPELLSSSGMSSSSVGEATANGANASTDEKTLAGDLWDDMKFNVEQKKDYLQSTLGKSKDLSNRRTPGVYYQYKYFLGRLTKQRLREARIQGVDFLILLLAGVCLGTLAKVSDEDFGSTGYLYTVISVSLLCKIGALRSFSLDKLHYWRESASGMSSTAYFLAKDTVDHFNTIVKPAVYLSMFYFFNNPRSSILDNYLILVCLVYCVTGIAYTLAIYFEPGQAQLWSVLLPVVLTLVANQDGDKFINKLGDYCFTKWALEAFLIANAKRYSGVWLVTRCGAILQKGYSLKHWYRVLGFLLATGVVSRGLAFFCLVTFQKK
ncbi:hypothetical protein Leryth_016440 [Lithospermum erythrorhizon]|nr:hypothetical protein Leryth_016440 [Lithospermum erythrorhizon]